MAKSIQIGLALGLLGIEFHSRRRNRAATHVRSLSEKGIELKINQSFGNCPKYIQQHKIPFDFSKRKNKVDISAISKFDQEAISLIQNADTFFVASEAHKKEFKDNEGADVSHRGGEKGFIRVDNSRTITIPDYSGNFHFNTFGNFLTNPKAGLLFIDFETGDLLTVTGKVEVLWDSPDVKDFPQAERLWTFNIDHGYWLKNALPFR